MAIPKSSIKKRGKVFYLHYSENGVRKRVSLHTSSLEAAKEELRRHDFGVHRGHPLVSVEGPGHNRVGGRRKLSE